MLRDASKNQRGTDTPHFIQPPAGPTDTGLVGVAVPLHHTHMRVCVVHGCVPHDTRVKECIQCASARARLVH